MNLANNTTVKRILVAVDTSPRSLAPLEMAVNLAARMQAQLEALFIEDKNLLDLAGLPFAKELDRTSGEARTLNAPNLTYALQTQTQRLRELMQSFGEQKQIQTNLRVVRGNYITEAIRAEADVLFLFTSKRVSVSTPRSRKRPGFTHSALPSTAPVCVSYTGNAASERSLLLASDLAETLGTELVILLRSEDGNSVSALKQKSSELLGANHRFRFDTIETNLATSARNITANGCSLLVMPKSEAESEETEVQALEVIHCPIVLVA